MRLLETVRDTDHLSIAMLEQYACPGVVFNTAMLIAYSGVEPRVKSNPGAIAKKTKSGLLIPMPIPGYQDIDNPNPGQARTIRRIQAAIPAVSGMASNV